MSKIQLSDHFNYRKLIKFTMPSIIMMIFTSVYGVVDGFFVSNLAGDIPFKALNLIWPYIMMMTTVGFMFGSGGTALVAKVYGEGDKEKANKYFSFFVYVTFIIGVVIAVVSYIFMRPIAILLGAEGAILENSIVYGRVLMCSLPFAVLQYLFQSFCVAAEKPKLGLYVIVAAGITNMMLDAVLVIFLPQEYKLMGAALASALSQVVGGGVPLVYFMRKNDSFLRIGKTKFYFKAILQACANGSSEFMSNVSMSIVGMLYNHQLLKYAGDDGIAAYGVMMYVSMIFSAVFVGYTIGVAPIISYHDGAKNHDEKKGILKKSFVIIGVCSVVMLILSEALAHPLSAIFVGGNEHLMNMTVSGFRIFSIAFAFMGFAIFTSSFFTALNDGLTSAIVPFLRTLVFQIGAVIILPIIMGGLDGIWWSVAVADIMAALLSVIFLIAKRKKYHY